MDFVVAAFDGDAIFWYENNGSQSFTERTVASGIDGPREIWPVDLDLDGDMDIIASIYFDQDLVWFENNGSQSFTKELLMEVLVVLQIMFLLWILMEIMI